MTFRIPRSRSRYARTTILSRVICQISGDRIQRGLGSPRLPGAGRRGVSSPRRIRPMANCRRPSREATAGKLANQSLRPRRRGWAGPTRWLRPRRGRGSGRASRCRSRCRRVCSRRTSSWRNGRRSRSHRSGSSSSSSRRCSSTRRGYYRRGSSGRCRCRRWGRDACWRYADVVNVLFVLAPARVEVKGSGIRHIGPGVV